MKQVWLITIAGALLCLAACSKDAKNDNDNDNEKSAKKVESPPPAVTSAQPAPKKVDRPVTEKKAATPASAGGLNAPGPPPGAIESPTLPRGNPTVGSFDGGQKRLRVGTRDELKGDPLAMAGEPSQEALALTQAVRESIDAKPDQTTSHPIVNWQTTSHPIVNWQVILIRLGTFLTFSVF